MGSEFLLYRSEQASDPASSRSLDAAFSLAYDELRRLARSVRRNDPNASITPTTIVNEAWIKLSRAPSIEAVSPLHFKRIVACAMRQVLVDSARRRQTQARGGDQQHVAFDEASSLGLTSTSNREVLALDSALDALARIEPRQAALVEARFFGGLETSEIAQLLGISEATVLRDWRAAKAWLAVEVRRSLQ